MWLTFRAYGNENRGKRVPGICRKRSVERKITGRRIRRSFRRYWHPGEQLDLSREEVMAAAGIKRKAEQNRRWKQRVGRTCAGAETAGTLYGYLHPIGGQPRPETLAALGEMMQTIDGTELRLAPDETAYIINLTGAEAEKILEATKETAQTKFETSVKAVSVRRSVRLVHAIRRLCYRRVKAVGEAQIPDGALPQIHISGCPSSCGTHQTGPMGFRGGVRMADGKAQPAFVFYLGGNEVQGKRRWDASLVRCLRVRFRRS